MRRFWSNWLLYLFTNIRCRSSKFILQGAMLERCTHLESKIRYPINNEHPVVSMQDSFYWRAIGTRSSGSDDAPLRFHARAAANPSPRLICKCVRQPMRYCTPVCSDEAGVNFRWAATFSLEVLIMLQPSLVDITEAEVLRDPCSVRGSTVELPD